MMVDFPEFIEDLWYGKHPLSILLAPLGWIYQLLMTLRHLVYQSGIAPIQRLDIPVIVVGNIVAGGTGENTLGHLVGRTFERKRLSARDRQ
jgi:tetraacyldisaccharide-1-P 4'-kinase